VPVVEPFFNRLNQIYPQYQTLGGYAHRPMRTLDGRNLGGLSTHATGMTLDVKAPDPVLRQMAKEFPHLTWGGKFSHYDPVHFEFGPTAEKYGELPPLSTKPFVGQAGAESAPSKPMGTPMAAAPVPRETPSAASMLGAPPMAQPEQPGPMDDFIARFQSPMTQQGLGLLMAAMQGGDLNAGASAGAQRGNMALQQLLQARKMQQEEKRRQAVAQMLNDPSAMSGVPAPLLRMAQATGDPGSIEQFLVKNATGGQTDDIKEYEYALRNGFKGSLQDWMVSKRASQGEYAKQPIYGVDKDGNPVVMQLGTRGDAKATAMPDGVRIQRDPIKMDAGDHYVLLDPTTRQPIGQVKKNLAEAEMEKVKGQDAGKALTSIPIVEANAFTAFDRMDQIKNHPGLKYAVGPQGILPAVPGTVQADFVNLFNEVKAGAFLDAFEALKGAGAISETEGKVATAARNRMERATTVDGFMKALEDYRGVIERGVVVVRRRAGVLDDGQAGKRLPDRQSPRAAPASPARDALKQKYGLE
jgi:hypothetical protein